MLASRRLAKAFVLTRVSVGVHLRASLTVSLLRLSLARFASAILCVPSADGVAKPGGRRPIPRRRFRLRNHPVSAAEPGFAERVVRHGGFLGGLEGARARSEVWDEDPAYQMLENANEA